MSLVLACFEGDIEAAVKLLEFGANKDHVDEVILTNFLFLGRTHFLTGEGIV
jgi:hypothetical protein